MENCKFIEANGKHERKKNTINNLKILISVWISKHDKKNPNGFVYPSRNNRNVVN